MSPLGQNKLIIEHLLLVFWEIQQLQQWRIKESFLGGDGRLAGRQHGILQATRFEMFLAEMDRLHSTADLHRDITHSMWNIQHIDGLVQERRNSDIIIYRFVTYYPFCT